MNAWAPWAFLAEQFLSSYPHLVLLLAIIPFQLQGFVSHFIELPEIFSCSFLQPVKCASHSHPPADQLLLRREMELTSLQT